MLGESPFFAVLLLALCLAIGVAVGMKLAKRNTPAVKSASSMVPEQWPLLARSVVKHNEAIIWRWVRASFPNQRVLLKLPFSRFTSPSDPVMGRDHYDMLNGLYATFTITDREGKVLGCIDLVSSMQGSTSSQRIKEGVLLQLGIAYEVLQGTSLPTPAAIRMAILNEHTDASESTFEELDDARTQLQELLGRQRYRRHPEHAEFRPSDLHDLTDSVPPSLWQSL